MADHTLQELDPHQSEDVLERVSVQFDGLSFREKWGKVLHGLRQPASSGEHVWARLQVRRLWAPVSALLVPLLLVVLLSAFKTPDRDEAPIVFRLEEPVPIDKLDDPIALPDPVIVPDHSLVDPMADHDIASPVADVPLPAADVQPLGPMVENTVAPIRSPVTLPGIFSHRGTEGRERARRAYGAPPGSDKVVLRSLRWLKSVQRDDGRWDDGCGLSEQGKYGTAMTSLALLVFLAHGETPESPEFGATVQRAMQWMIENQEESGLFKHRDGHNYSHPIATYALCEAFALTQVPMVKDAAEKAAEHIVRGQNASGGWNYNMKPSQRDDTSYMGWCAQAMKAARIAGLEVDGIDSVLRNAIKGFQKNASPQGGFGYTTPRNSNLTGVGVLCMQLLGAAKIGEAKRGVAWIRENRTFNWDDAAGSHPIYYWYYDTQAMFHQGGPAWDAWNAQFAPELMRTQTIVAEAVEDLEGKRVDIGYWGAPGEREEKYGLVYSTTLCTLQLEVYHRYLPTYKAPGSIDNTPTVIGAEDEDIKIEIGTLKPNDRRRRQR